jgi:hypothetical protein
MLPNKVHQVELPCKPSVGDSLPVNYMTEKVELVAFRTTLFTDIATNIDLIIYVK